MNNWKIFFLVPYSKRVQTHGALTHLFDCMEKEYPLRPGALSVKSTFASMNCTDQIASIVKSIFTSKQFAVYLHWCESVESTVKPNPPSYSCNCLRAASLYNPSPRSSHHTWPWKVWKPTFPTSCNPSSVPHTSFCNLLCFPTPLYLAPLDVRALSLLRRWSLNLSHYGYDPNCLWSSLHLMSLFRLPFYFPAFSLLNASALYLCRPLSYPSQVSQFIDLHNLGPYCILRSASFSDNVDCCKHNQVLRSIPVARHLPVTTIDLRRKSYIILSYVVLRRILQQSPPSTINVSQQFCC